MKEKFIRLIIYYFISVYDEEKRTKESCLELAKALLFYIMQNEETKVDEWLNAFPSKHPVPLIYNEIKKSDKEELKDIMEKAKININKYSFDGSDLNNLENERDVGELSKKISEM